MPKQTKYEECKSKTINNVIKEFEHKILKSPSGTQIKSKKQAIAISLNIADNKCQKYMLKSDLSKLKTIVEKQIYDKNHNIRSDSKKVPTSVIKYITIICKSKYYNNAMKSKLKNDMILRVFYSLRNQNNYNLYQINQIISMLS